MDEPTNERCLRLLDLILAIVPDREDDTDNLNLKARLRAVRASAEWHPPWATAPAERASRVLAEEIGAGRHDWRAQVHKIWTTGEAG